MFGVDPSGSPEESESPGSITGSSVGSPRHSCLCSREAQPDTGSRHTHICLPEGQNTVEAAVGRDAKEPKATLSLPGRSTNPAGNAFAVVLIPPPALRASAHS